MSTEKDGQINEINHLNILNLSLDQLLIQLKLVNESLQTSLCAYVDKESSTTNKIAASMDALDQLISLIKQRSNT
jgi:hypothetical protein